MQTHILAHHYHQRGLCESLSLENGVGCICRHFCFQFKANRRYSKVKRPRKQAARAASASFMKDRKLPPKAVSRRLWVPAGVCGIPHGEACTMLPRWTEAGHGSRCLQPGKGHQGSPTSLSLSLSPLRGRQYHCCRFLLNRPSSPGYEIHHCGIAA